ncbi:MAG: hypothetical protein QOJ90_1427 [Actinomycetota bacterium]|nr:hypothetical protein [Actinomycetota bacterium]
MRRLHGPRQDRIAEASTPAWRLTAGAAAIIVCLDALWLVRDSGSPRLDQQVTDVMQILAPLAATLACVWAAFRRPHQRRAWGWLAASCGVWTAGSVTWACYELVLGSASPSPSWADAGFLCYAAPAVVGLVLLPVSGSLRGDHSRQLLDGLVVSLSLFLVGWIIVIGPLLEEPAGHMSFLVQLVSVGYPLFDFVVASVVLVRGMRAGRAQRLPWLFLSAGLMVLAVTDTIYVHGTLTETYQVGGLLDAGWVAAFLLLTLAALAPVPPPAQTELDGRLTIVQESLPFFPVVLAFATIALARPVLSIQEPTAWLITLLLAIVVVRYVIRTHDHLVIAEHLEGLVASRTVALEHQAFHDALTGLPNRAHFLAELTTTIDALPGIGLCSVL